MNFNVDGIFNNVNEANTEEGFVEELVPKLQEILIERFDNYQRRQIIKGNKSIRCCCPLCGDSATDNSRKRGNLILEGKFANTYKCFNCGAFMPLSKFFEMYDKTLSFESINYINNNREIISRGISDASNNIALELFNLDKINELAIDREYLKSKLNLVEVKGTFAEKYLRGRLQFNDDKFLYNEKYNKLFVLNNTSDGKVLGLQIKCLDKNFDGPKYITYKLSNIYSVLLKEDIEVDDSIDSISMLFNILTINYNKPIIVLEGPMDSFLVPNSIATTGASKNIPLEMEFYYMYDNDDTGKKHAIEQINNGSNVFLWSKFSNDISLPYRSKWDVNDVYKYCRENNIKVPKLLNYFSNDPYDAFDI